MSVIFGVIVVVLAIFCEAFFSGAETGIISTNQIKLFYLADKGNRRAKIIKNFIDNKNRLLGTTLVGVNLSVIVASSVASEVVRQLLPDSDYASLITTAILLPFILIFGEIIPKAMFHQYADTITLWSAYPLKIASIVLFPFVWIATKISFFVTSILGKDKIKKIPSVTREELRLLLIESAKQGYLTKDEIRMAYGIFDLGRTNVRSVMVPLSDVVSASWQSKPEDVAELIAQSGYSRVPIYKDKPQDIIGTVQVNDLMASHLGGRAIIDMIRAPYIVQEERAIDEVLKEFQNNQKGIAIVKNTQNQTIGIVSLEDIVEEIVGEIGDEYDTGS